jgi:hypothetical protein
MNLPERHYLDCSPGQPLPDFIVGEAKGEGHIVVAWCSVKNVEIVLRFGSECNFLT